MMRGVTVDSILNTLGVNIDTINRIRLAHGVVG